MAGERIVQQGVSAEGIVLPFDEFVFKEPRCDLEPRYDRDGTFLGGCDYIPEEVAAETGMHGCYEYAFYKARSEPISEVVLKQAARQIGLHAVAHGLEHVRVIKHGGEPLLRGAEELAAFSEIVPGTIRAKSPSTSVHLGIQTNGLRLAPTRAEGEPEAQAMLTILKSNGYQVGLSLDGDQKAQDRHRRGPRGNSTYDQVVEAARRLREKEIDWGILCVIDTKNDPITTVEALARLNPKSISLLLPHANHSLPKPPGPVPYGDWLIQAFDWYYDRRPDPSEGETELAMPIFDAYMDTLLGGRSMHESVANRTVQELFILSNGYYQRVDTLKSTEQGAVATGMNVGEHSLDDVARRDPGIIARRLGNAGLAQECLECPLLKPCGGGYYPHRFMAGKQRIQTTDPPEVYAKAFRHPTVYCDDQLELLPHIAARMEDDMGLPRGRLIKMLAAA